MTRPHQRKRKKNNTADMESQNFVVEKQTYSEEPLHKAQPTTPLLDRDRIAADFEAKFRNYLEEMVKQQRKFQENPNPKPHAWLCVPNIFKKCFKTRCFKKAHVNNAEERHKFFRPTVSLLWKLVHDDSNPLAELELGHMLRRGVYASKDLPKAKLLYQSVCNKPLAKTSWQAEAASAYGSVLLAEHNEPAAKYWLEYAKKKRNQAATHILYRLNHHIPLSQTY